ncbi:MAG: general stress protein [Propionibacteriaceae bacterium]
MATITPKIPKSFVLEYPMTVANYDSYQAAQKAVDHLADENFPVENIAIVGTDLRQYERVLGKSSWMSVLLSGAAAGAMSGLMIALMLFLLRVTTMGNAFLVGIGLGIIFGALSAAMSYAVMRGQRDFNSLTQTFANSYEVVAEHKVAQQAREILEKAGLSGLVAKTAAPQTPTYLPTEK